MSYLIKIFTVCFVYLIFIPIIQTETKQGRCPNLDDCRNLPNFTLNLIFLNEQIYEGDTQYLSEQKGSINKGLYNLQFEVKKSTHDKRGGIMGKGLPQQEMNWCQFYLMSFNCIVDVKLRNFNRKYLMIIIPNKNIWSNSN